MTRKFLLVLIASMLTSVSNAELTVPKYCALIRDQSNTESYIKFGLKMHEDGVAYLSANPSKKAYRKWEDDVNARIKEIIEKDLAIAYEADNQINREHPDNNFPQFARDQVLIKKHAITHAFENGGSVIENREWVYNFCMSVVGKMQ